MGVDAESGRPQAYLLQKKVKLLIHYYEYNDYCTDYPNHYERFQVAVFIFSFELFWIVHL